MNPFKEDKQYFPTVIQQWQYLDKYARFNHELKRRETWIESIDRVIQFLYDLAGDRLSREEWEELRLAMLNMEIMPSMRLLAMAGPAAHRNNITIYNCSFLGIDDICAWGEAMLIAMNGCGVGYSVEEKFINKLPKLAPTLNRSKQTFVIPDDTEGWQQAINYHIERLYAGEIINFDYSELRPAGSILKIKGGRASGPEPLQDTMDFIEEVFMAHYSYNELLPHSQKLTSLDAHDMMCSVAHASVAGGVRRAALISIFDIYDEKMLKAKNGTVQGYRYNANNSAAWDKEIDEVEFLMHMAHMFDKDNGEPAIYNRYYLPQQLPERRDKNHIFGVNPCGEIILRHMQFCNLSAAVAREHDTYKDLAQKVRLASKVGTIQSMATNFPGLRDQWKKNCEEERLLGVDITGQRDSFLLNTCIGNTFKSLAFTAIEENKLLAETLGINQSAAVTCVKPSGNTSVLVDCASGLHARPFKHYLRNVFVDSNSPVTKVLLDSKVPMTEYRNGYLVHFPVKAPESAIIESEQTALDQLAYWAKNKIFYTEHNPSVSIKYRKSEILDIIKWLWDHREIVGGITFMPVFNGNYDYLPIEPIDEEKYKELNKAFPNIDFSLIQKYEEDDMTKAAQELACLAGACELVL